MHFIRKKPQNTLKGFVSKNNCILLQAKLTQIQQYILDSYFIGTRYEKNDHDNLE
jgi:hypothetical protein